jgi:hypothetical protein
VTADLQPPVARATAAVAARSLEALSRIRRKRIFHPYGVGFAGRLMPRAERLVGAPALATESEVVVRLSRALGLPEWLPDPCGLGLRIPDAYGRGRHQDLLMVSSATAPLVRHAILPARGFLDRPYSTVLPYRFRQRLILIGVQALKAERPGPKLAQLRDRELAGLEFDLAIASLGGEWHSAARLSLGPRLASEETERLDLDPTNTGGGLELAGFLNDLRGPSYRRSQAGREASY